MKLIDIFNDIEFKGDKATTILKWVVSISIVLIVGAFALGQIKSNHFKKLEQIEALAKEGIKKTSELETKIDDGLKDVNDKIDGIYEDGSDIFEEYIEFQKKQQLLILKYGQKNQKLLEEVLELNQEQLRQEIKKDIDDSKRESTKREIPETKIEVRPTEKK